MGSKPIKFHTKTLRLHKALVSPEFNERTVLVRDHWEYVEMWLKREKHPKAQEFWQQAKDFYYASLDIPLTAAPLTLYYSFLNASKALFEVKGLSYKESHGATGQVQDGNTNLKNEIIKFHPNGILSSLCRYYGEPCNNEEYSLKDLLYNLPFIHRSFQLTYGSGYPELFIPIINPHFVIKDTSHEAWFTAETAENYGDGHILKQLKPLGFERDLGIKNKFFIRKKTRFNWYKSGPNKINNLQNLNQYHKNIRKDVQYISGNSTLWYIKRRNLESAIARVPSTMILASMHRLSELSRYQPTILFRHFELTQNWLLSEFIKISPHEFIDQLACEITNQNFLQPAIRTPS